MAGVRGELRMNNIYVPKDKITSLPSGWNGEDTVLHSEYACTPFDFLNNPREDVYSLEDGEEQVYKNRKAYDRCKHNPKINPHELIEGTIKE